VQLFERRKKGKKSSPPYLFCTLLKNILTDFGGRWETEAEAADTHTKTQKGKAERKKKAHVVHYFSLFFLYIHIFKNTKV